MQERIIYRYSACFKQRVVAELESGRFASIQAARMHYGIGGSKTIQKWLKRYGKNHLLAKVVRVQTPNEADQCKELRKRVAELEQALGRTQAENLLHQELLKQACGELGQDVDTFKKSIDGTRSTGSSKTRKSK